MPDQIQATGGRVCHSDVWKRILRWLRLFEVHPEKNVSIQPRDEAQLLLMFMTLALFGYISSIEQIGGVACNRDRAQCFYQRLKNDAWGTTYKVPVEPLQLNKT